MSVPVTAGEMLTEHVTATPVPDNVHDPLGVNVTVPAGVVAPVGAVSVTVAVQRVATLTGTDNGVQLTVVLVGFAPTVSVA